MLSEEDVKRLYITPALESKWDRARIRMEMKITDGRIILRGNMASRGPAKRADYVLFDTADVAPLAVVEAKDDSYSAAHGLAQAMTYAQMLDVKFAYATNGRAFVEHDFLTGAEREFPMGEFPTEAELLARLNAARPFCENERKVMAQPYYTNTDVNTPRYYQRVAVNRVVNAYARGEKRMLLVMATGTGKTCTAFQIVHRLIKSRLVRKVLYLADRNNLIDQSIGDKSDFAPFKNALHKINFSREERQTVTAYEVYFSLYQQLAEREDEGEAESGGTAKRLAELFSPNFFDLIIVDECHRGSAKQDSAWREVLDYFSSAAQLGMTATPRETKEISNIDYFGDPLFVYSLREGVEDGFLAPFKVYNVHTDISEGWRPYKGQCDDYGKLIPDRIYGNSDFDYDLILSARTREVAEQITAHLKQTGRMQKTIVFCANIRHAERMRRALIDLNTDMTAVNPDYVVQITGDIPEAQEKLSEFNKPHTDYPVIVTTSKLLTTGADCKMTKLIVLDQCIGSMTEFKQIIGRGTRIRESDGKTHFTVMDFRNVTRLFADPEWDGPIEQNENYDPKRESKKLTPPVAPTPERTEPPEKYYVGADGCKVSVLGVTVSIYDAQGKLLRAENIIDYTRENVRGDCATLRDFIHYWTGEEKKAAVRDLLRSRGIDLEAMKAEQGMTDVDDFDFICHVAYDAKPLTRRERANNVKKRDFLSRYSGDARAVLEALLDRYSDDGVYEIEDKDILRLDPFTRFGKPARIAQLFGGKEGYLRAVNALKAELYEVM